MTGFLFWLVLFNGLIFIVESYLVNEIPDFQPRTFSIHTLSVDMYEADREKPAYCDLWLNYDQKADYGGDKLFRYVNDAVSTGQSFSAFINAFNRVRIELRNNPRSSANTRATIFREFLTRILNTPVFVFFKDTFKENGHPWFIHDDPNYLFERLVKLWASNIDQKSGFDHIFMGEPIDASIGPGKYEGMHSWVSFYMNELSGYVHYRKDLEGDSKVVRSRQPIKKNYVSSQK